MIGTHRSLWQAIAVSRLWGVLACLTAVGLLAFVWLQQTHWSELGPSNDDREYSLEQLLDLNELHTKRIQTIELQAEHYTSFGENGPVSPPQLSCQLQWFDRPGATRLFAKNYPLRKSSAFDLFMPSTKVFGSTLDDRYTDLNTGARWHRKGSSGLLGSDEYGFIEPAIATLIGISPASDLKSNLLLCLTPGTGSDPRLTLRQLVELAPTKPVVTKTTNPTLWRIEMDLPPAGVLPSSSDLIGTVAVTLDPAKGYAVSEFVTIRSPVILGPNGVPGPTPNLVAKCRTKVEQFEYNAEQNVYFPIKVKWETYRLPGKEKLLAQGTYRVTSFQINQPLKDALLGFRFKPNTVVRCFGTSDGVVPETFAVWGDDPEVPKRVFNSRQAAEDFVEGAASDETK